nr:integrase, catalytic region, zinc finger, CCHC-type, peptidase aspartic, catalytic [Tanacetum cinerariifolium]
ETLAESTEGTPQFGPERLCVYSDLNSNERDWYNADIQATNILLQGLPKDIYTLINHYIDAKDIWDNVKMLLEGSELTKEDRESQLYDDFEHFRQCKEESNNDYYVRGQGMNPWGGNAAGYGEAHNRVGNVNQGQALPGQARTVKCYNCNGTGHIAWNSLDAEQQLFLAGGPDNAFNDDVDEQPLQDLALNVYNVFQAEDYHSFDLDVDETPTAQTMFMANLSSGDPITDEA